MRQLYINAFYRNTRKSFSTISWNHLKKRPADPIYGLVAEFRQDKDSRKVNLSQGTYKDDNGNPYLLNSIQKAHDIILKKGFDMEYLPIDGLKSFVDNTLKLAYGEGNLQLKEGKIIGVQSLSGTGALRLGFEFIKDFYPHNKTIYIPNKTWPNHHNVIEMSGLKYKEYTYYNDSTKSLNFSGFINDLNKAENHSIILLHSSAHNPTGVDLNQSQWEEVLSVIKAKSHFPFFDMAYQGFTSGNIDLDAYAVRLFAENSVEMALAQSFAKNFGLYGQRVGTLSFALKDTQTAENVLSQLKFTARAQYSSPPKHGAHLVDLVLSNKELTDLWKEELLVMSGRIKEIRKQLYEHLKNTGSRLNWDHIVNQIGMFAFTGLTKEQVALLKKNYHIYMTEDGRISLSGLNSRNVEYVAQAFHLVTLHNFVKDKQNS